MREVCHGDRVFIYLHDVVLTVNHVYASIVPATTAAKSQPNLYVCLESVDCIHNLVFTHKNAADHGNFQRGRDNAEKNGLQNKHDTSSNISISKIQ